jgi:hypothetical protein
MKWDAVPWSLWEVHLVRNNNGVNYDLYSKKNVFYNFFLDISFSDQLDAIYGPIVNLERKEWFMKKEHSSRHLHMFSLLVGQEFKMIDQTINIIRKLANPRNNLYRPACDLKLSYYPFYNPNKFLTSVQAAEWRSRGTKHNLAQAFSSPGLVLKGPIVQCVESRLSISRLQT